MATKASTPSSANIHPGEKYHYSIVSRDNYLGSIYTDTITARYGIFNQSSHAIYVSSALLGNIKIPSQFDPDESRQPEGIVLEVEVYVNSLNYINRCKQIAANTPLDIAIKEIMTHELECQGALHDNTHITDASVKFRLRLNTVTPSKGKSGYYSEILGLYINAECDSLAHFLIDLPEAVTEHIDDKSQVHSEYQMSYVIDNDNEMGNVWTMINGKAVMLRRGKHRCQPSGLYIFNNDTANVNPGYKYLTVAEVNNKDILSAEGYALSEESLAEKNHTKEYKSLKETEHQHTQLKDEFKALKKLYDLIVAEKEGLETNIEAVVEAKVKEINAAHEKTVKEINAAHDNAIKELTQSHSREVKDLQRDVQRAKKLLAEEQSDEAKMRKRSSDQIGLLTTLIGCAVNISKLIIDALKFTGLGRQTR